MLSYDGFNKKNSCNVYAADKATVVAVAKRKINIENTSANSFAVTGYKYTAKLNSGAKVGPVTSMTALLMRIEQALPVTANES